MCDAAPPLLEVRDLSVRFRTKQGDLAAVDGVSYAIDPGRTLGIVGESGCGKTVTALAVMGLIEAPGRIAGGQVRLRGKDLVTLSERQMQDIRGNRIAMIFQEPMTAFNPVFRIGDQIDEQIRRHTGSSRENARRRTLEMLDLVGIPASGDLCRRYPHELSGGMRQRAMIAMALSCKPDLLIADEPTTAVDVTLQEQILALLERLQEELDMAIQFITHDLGVISEIADDVLVMYAGKVCERASVRELFDQPRHPYTVGLLQSIPRLGERCARLSSIPGTVPALAELPPGCPFQNRCPNVGDDCRHAMPAFREISPGHGLACHHPVA